MKKLTVLLVLFVVNINAQWVQTNYRYINPAVTTLIQIPSENGRKDLVAGTWGNGIFISTDNGISWTAINNGLTSLAVATILHSEADLFAGTWQGVFISTDSGSTWNEINTGLGNKNVRALEIIDNNLFAGTEGGGIYLSTNKGTSWTAVNNGMGISYVYDLIAMPNGTDSTYLFAGTSWGIYLSSNLGSDWTLINSDLPYVTSFAANGQNLFVGTYLGGVHISTNFGADWSPINNGLNDTHILELYVSDSILFAGTVDGVFYSSNNGDNWVSLNPELHHIDVFTILETDSNLIVGTRDAGIFKSTNNGLEWTRQDVYLKKDSSEIYTLLIDQDSLVGTVIYTGGAGDIVYYSSDLGNSWYGSHTGLDYGFIFDFAKTYNQDGSSNLFASGSADGITKSTDKGKSWNFVNTGLTDIHVHTLATYNNLENVTHLFAGTFSDIFISSDNGSNWISTNIGIEAPDFRDFAIIDTNIFAASYGEGVFISTNFGQSWTSVNSGISGAAVSDLAIINKNLFAGCNNGIFKSTNLGLNWTEVETGIEYLNVNSFTVYENNIFVATYSGLLLTTDSGENWVKVDSGLFSESVLALATDGIYLFAGTYNGEIWRRPLSEMITDVDDRENEISTQFVLQQNYPNPFNPSTTISFSLPSQSFVSLKIFDLLGKEVATILSEELPAGNYKREWNAQSFSSGVYFYRLQAGDFVETKKLILLR